MLGLIVLADLEGILINMSQLCCSQQLMPNKP